MFNKISKMAIEAKGTNSFMVIKVYSQRVKRKLIEAIEREDSNIKIAIEANEANRDTVVIFCNDTSMLNVQIVNRSTLIYVENKNEAYILSSMKF